MNPKCGAVAQIIIHGSSPLIKNTANSIPQIKNHLLAFSDMVLSTSAFMTALSILLITSNSIKPTTISILDSISIFVCVFLLCF